MGINVLTNEVVHHFFNLIVIVRNRQIVCYAKSRIWEELLILIHWSTCSDSIYKIKKARKHLVDDPASERVKVGSFAIKAAGHEACLIIFLSDSSHSKVSHDQAGK